MNFKNIYKDDYEQYINLNKTTISKTYYDNFLDNILNDNHLIIKLSDNDNNLIGTGTIFIEEKLTHGGSKLGHIENIIIDEKYRGKGYGELLVNYLLNICNNKKCYRVDLVCTTELEHFYNKNNINKNNISMSILFKDNFN